MVHGPCRTYNPTSTCLVNGQCQENFQMAFREEKSNNGETVHVGNCHVDNRYVVPFSKDLLKKYQARINLSVCSSLKKRLVYTQIRVQSHSYTMMEINNKYKTSKAGAKG